MNILEKLKKAVAGMEDDFDKFNTKGNAAAGTRVRKSLQDIKAIAQEGRTWVTEEKAKGGKEGKEDEPIIPW